MNWAVLAFRLWTAQASGLQQFPKGPKSQITHSTARAQYKSNCQNNTTTPNSLKSHTKIQTNACMGFIITNLKFFFFRKFGFGTIKIGGGALTPILNSWNSILRDLNTHKLLKYLKYKPNI